MLLKSDKAAGVTKWIAQKGEPLEFQVKVHLWTSVSWNQEHVGLYSIVTTFKEPTIFKDFYLFPIVQ